jgi:PPM family protein phosphatase
MSKSDQTDDSRFLHVDSKGPRDEQQDAGICLSAPDKGTALLVVCDGVGGKGGGRLASQTVTELARQMWHDRQGIMPDPIEDLAAFCREAHERINHEGSKQELSPRTTVVALYLTPTQAYWVHSGDSRLYHFRAGQLLQRTEDHSVLQILVKQGIVAEKDMGTHPDQGALLQSLGGDEYKPPTCGQADISPEDGFLLCTDGFWERTKVAEMAELLFCTGSEATSLLEQAIARAVERNGPKGDNVTVAVARPVANKIRLVKRTDPRVALMLLAALLAFFAVLLLRGTGRMDKHDSSPQGQHPAASSAPVPNPSFDQHRKTVPAGQ